MGFIALIILLIFVWPVVILFNRNQFKLNTQSGLSWFVYFCVGTCIVSEASALYLMDGPLKIVIETIRLTAHIDTYMAKAFFTVVFVPTVSTIIEIFCIEKPAAKQLVKIWVIQTIIWAGYVIGLPLACNL